MGNSQNPDMANKYGQIYMKTDSKNYFQGEAVTGSIFVNIIQPYPGKTLHLLIEGQEFCQWIKCSRKKNQLKPKLEKRKRRGPKGFRDIYSHKIAIHSFADQKIPKGQWNFPFRFELDKDMPASFRFNSPKIDSFISYKMKAVISSAEPKLVKNMEHFQELNIFQIRDENYAPLSKNVSLEAKLLWFISRGNTQINAFLNKNNYVLGEEIHLTCEIDNKVCKSEVTFIELDLIRKLELKSNNSSEKKKNFKLLSRRNDLFIPENHNNVVTTEFKFKLANEARTKNKNINYTPNTSIGKLVKNYYILKLKINYGGFLGAKVHKIVLPLMIYEKGYDEKVNPVNVQPPIDWNPQLMPLRNVSMIDAVFVEPEYKPNDNGQIAGYEYPIMNQDNIWTDEKFQMMK